MCVPHRREWAADHETEIGTTEWELWANEFAYEDGDASPQAPPPAGMEEVSCLKCGPIYVPLGSSNHRCGKSPKAPAGTSKTLSTWPEMFKTVKRPTRAELDAHNAKTLKGWKADREEAQKKRLEEYRDKQQFEPGFGQNRWGNRR
jgi:hypothetical protein